MFSPQNLCAKLKQGPKGPSGHLNTIAPTQPCRGISYMYLIKFHSGIKKN